MTQRKTRNPVARDLRTPKYRPRVIPDKRVEQDRKAAKRADADWRWRNDWD